MTRADLLDDNRDLLGYCGRLLAAEPSTGLEVTTTTPNLEVSARGLDRIDIYVDDRPLGSVAIANDRATLPVPAVWETLTIEAFTVRCSISAAASDARGYRGLHARVTRIEVIDAIAVVRQFGPLPSRYSWRIHVIHSVSPRACRRMGGHAAASTRPSDGYRGLIQLDIDACVTSILTSRPIRLSLDALPDRDAGVGSSVTRRFSRHPSCTAPHRRRRKRLPEGAGRSTGRPRPAS
jgi:hypothetical protein